MTVSEVDRVMDMGIKMVEMSGVLARCGPTRGKEPELLGCACSSLSRQTCQPPVNTSDMPPLGARRQAGGNSIGVEGAKAVAAVLKDAQLVHLEASSPSTAISHPFPANVSGPADTLCQFCAVSRQQS